MSTEIIGVEPIEESLYNTAVPTGPPPANQYAPRATSRLSTFHMPGAVEIQVNSVGQCIFRFLYSNDEPGERVARRLSSDVEVLLGKHSRKVLELRVGQATHWLRSSVPFFTASAAQSWVDELPWHSRFPSQRNAEVVEALMKAMPESIREATISRLHNLFGMGF